MALPGDYFWADRSPGPPWGPSEKAGSRQEVSQEEAGLRGGHMDRGPGGSGSGLSQSPAKGNQRERVERFLHQDGVFAAGGGNPAPFGERD